MGQEGDLESATLPAELDWEATKTETLVPPPYGLEPVPVGTNIDGTLAVVQDCLDGSCQPASAIDLSPQMPSEPVPLVAWEQAGSRWELPGEGSFVSAEYPDGTTCVYQHTERWDLVVTETAADGDRVVATRLEGTFERADVLDVARSVGDVDGFCPPYEARDLWSVVATAIVDQASITSPPTAPTPSTGTPSTQPSGGSSEPAAGTSDSGGGDTSLVLIVVAALVLVAGGTAAALWLGSWWGSAGCTAGTKRSCVVERIFLLPYDEDLDATEKFDRNLRHVSDFAKYVGIVSMVVNPTGASAAMPAAGARAGLNAAIADGLQGLRQQGRDHQVAGFGFDVYIEISWQCCKSALLRGTYWEECSTVMLIPPPSSDAAMLRPDNSGWKSTLPDTPLLLDVLTAEVERLAPTACQNCC